MGLSLPGDVTVNPVVVDVRDAVARDYGIGLARGQISRLGCLGEDDGGEEGENT